MGRINQGIILAAGRGSRLNEMTDDKPKCLTVFTGKTLLQNQIETLSAAMISNITVLRGYLKETLSPEKLNLNFSTLDNNRWSETNMVATLACADNLLQQATSIISYSDIVYKSEHVTKLMNTRGDICLSYDTDWHNLWSQRFPDPLVDAETFISSDGILEEIGGKASCVEEIQGQYMGLLKITPKGWETISNYLSKIGVEQTANLDMTGLLSNLLKENVKINVCPISGGWLEVDTQSDLHLYEDDNFNH